MFDFTLYCCIGHYVGNYYVDIINQQFCRKFHQTNEFARNNLHTNIMYLKASTDVKISTFLEKNGWMRLWITKRTCMIIFIGLTNDSRPLFLNSFIWTSQVLVRLWLICLSNVITCDEKTNYIRKL